MDENIEIEIQVSVENIKPLEELLSSKAERIGKSRQIDTYYSPKNPSFTDVRPVVEWLRIRKEDGGYSIGYKHWHHDGPGNAAYCDEYETDIKDPDQLTNIFEALNFSVVVTVDKVRRKYMYKNYEIAIDSVKGLGNFVEIEYKIPAKKQDARKITDAMNNFLTDLGCGKITENAGGYAFQLFKLSNQSAD